MAQRILNLIFKASVSDAKSKLKELEGKPGQEGGVFGLSAAIDTAAIAWAAYGTAVIAAGTIIKNEIENYSDYVTEVDNLGASLGLAAEDASFLMAAMQRYEISNDTMVAVFRKLSSEGIDPTVENLGKLLEQWEAMPEGSEKGQFAMQNFGEQGIKQLLPWWDKLTDAQKEAFGSQEDGIVITQEMIDKNREFETAVADLTDAWSIFKMELLSGVIPALTDVIETSLEGMEVLGNMGAALSNVFTGRMDWGVDLSNIRPPGGASTSNTRRNTNIGHATGGQFIVGGSGGTDQTPVSFMATPGETVSIGGGTNDNKQILAEMRRLVDTLPVVLADTMERR